VHIQLAGGTVHRSHRMIKLVMVAIQRFQKFYRRMIAVVAPAFG
jgi:hypothetical protein